MSKKPNFNVREIDWGADQVQCSTILVKCLIRAGGAPAPRSRARASFV
jgi:hypothetical protein